MSTFNHVADRPSSSERAAVVTDLPPGLAYRSSVVSPSSTSGVSVSTSPRASLGLIFSRTRRRPAGTAGNRRTPAGYGFDSQLPANATSRPPSPQRHPPTLGSKPAAQDLLPHNAVLHTTTRCFQPRPHQVLRNRTPRDHRRPPTRGLLPHRPSLFCKYYLNYRIPLSSPLMTCIFVPASSITLTPDWAREQRAEDLCSAILRFPSLG